MGKRDPRGECSCGCDEGLDRRVFLASTGLAAGSAVLSNRAVGDDTLANGATAKKRPARVRAVFIYPPSSSFADNPNGWWSWPGNDFDAEGRQQQYMTALRKMEEKLDLQLQVDRRSVANQQDAQRVAQEIQADQPDAVLLIMFYNQSLAHADLILKTTEEAKIPSIFFIGLGVKHGPINRYLRPGLYFIQSLDNLDAIEFGLRMVCTKKRMSQSRLLSITEAPEPREGVEKFFGITVKVTPFRRYAELFEQVELDDDARALIARYTQGAREVRNLTSESLENAARAHCALKSLLAEENADGLTMNCLRRGMLKPCISFATLNDQLIPAACENDLPAVYTQLLGQSLVERPGFQHNPCYETEQNHYYGSHCTCPTKVYGPAGDQLPYLLRRFAHTNEGSTAIQVFWNPGDPVTMVRYYPGDEPALDIYAGQVVQSHPMPPAAGCTTNVEIEISNREQAYQVRGHHNLIFCGDLARKFRLFANLYRMKVVEA
jgi:hypothetical protein